MLKYIVPIFLKYCKEKSLKERINLIDEVRGVCIILVVVYHLFYSMTMVFSMEAFYEIFAVMRIWQPILPAMFILISGISFQLSRNNVKRGLILLLISAAITLILWIFMPKQIIWFGILHFLAVMNIGFGLTKKYIDKIPAVFGLIIFAFLFILTYNVHRGYLGIEGIWSFKLPEALYQTDLTAPIGFYTENFRSTDYNPLLPWMFMFLIGTILGRYAKNLPESLRKTHIRPLAFIGRHTLIIYLIHQPVIIGALYLFTWKK